jgi:hypothetical protein
MPPRHFPTHDRCGARPRRGAGAADRQHAAAAVKMKASI